MTTRHQELLSAAGKVKTPGKSKLEVDRVLRAREARERRADRNSDSDSSDSDQESKR